MKYNAEFRPYHGNNNKATKLLAFANVHYGDFVVKDFKIMDKDGRLAVYMPSKKISSDPDRYTSVAYIEDQARKQAFEKWLIGLYKKYLKNEEKKEE